MEKKLNPLCLENLFFQWPNGKVAIRNCSFSVPSSGLWMIVGINGSGKSTLFRLITGMNKPQNGVIKSDLKPSLMFQNPDHQLLMPTCGCDVLLSIPVEIRHDERIRRMRNALAEVDLLEMESRPIHSLSGGQKQRVALAGALASESNLLLLDEPTALLDPASQIMILDTVKKLCNRKKLPITALWITHRLEELDYCDAVAVMENGSIGEWLPSNLIRQRLKLTCGE